MESKVSIFPITQATTATFTELYFRLTFFFFIQRGSKYVLCPTQGEVIGEEGDLMIFPPGSMVTVAERPRLWSICSNSYVVSIKIHAFIEAPIEPHRKDHNAARQMEGGDLRSVQHPSKRAQTPTRCAMVVSRVVISEVLAHGKARQDRSSAACLPRMTSAGHRM